MTDKIPVVKLGGKEFKIPPLVLKQNKRIDRLLANNIAFFDKLTVEEFGKRLLVLDQKSADDFVEIVYVALTRDQPNLTREAFEALPISLTEVIGAIPIIMQQSGLFKKAPLQGAPLPGEAEAPLT